MSISARLSSVAGALAVAGAVSLWAVPALSQVTTCSAAVPTYTTWQTSWNTWDYNHNHVVLGMVGGFKPYRLTVVSQDGASQVIDLKPGTAIFPTGQTPSSGEHVAIVGYWSGGTFVANRVILRP
ncbi:MAG: hypothetical protein ACREMP_02215 [Candidatus Tyrphobacter sp.]